MSKYVTKLRLCCVADCSSTSYNLFGYWSRVSAIEDVLITHNVAIRLCEVCDMMEAQCLVVVVMFELLSVCLSLSII